MVWLNGWKQLPVGRKESRNQRIGPPLGKALWSGSCGAKLTAKVTYLDKERRGVGGKNEVSKKHLPAILVKVAWAGENEKVIKIPSFGQEKGMQC